MKKAFLMIFGIVFLYSCSSTYHGRGWELIGDQDFQNAKDYFQSQLKTDENSYIANFGLGLTYYYLNEFDNSVKHLEKANSIQPQKSEIKYFTGLCYESMKQYDNALNYYEYFKDKTIDSKYKTDMEKRYTGVLKLKYREEAKSIISRENQLQGTPSDNTLAILSFENNSGNPEYDPMKQGFPVMFITDFSLIPKIKIVERLRLQALLDEIKLNKPETFDVSTIQRTGKLLAAKQILKGSFKITPANDLSFDLAIIEVQTGEVKYPVSKNSKLDDFYRLEKDIVLTMAEKMGITVSTEIRQKILIIPTESFFDFLERYKANEEMEKVELPTASTALESAIAEQTVLSQTMGRLNALDNNTGTEKTGQRTDIPSRFLPDPPLPPR